MRISFAHGACQRLKQAPRREIPEGSILFGLLCGELALEGAQGQEA
jgi:hypothetical protein